ncbi:MAG TPA: UDP-glucose--hexose-1-phosphate uridylyltransferase [Lachnospiraceae bacterium]|jgi:UDPglucose--hexose-1-phosphate uridylyltransferase|nr:UDP-glucose--hexose-1-phosphate uridylyltransferase [Lachnospiraceae bacterium]
MLSTAIKKLVVYGLETGLIPANEAVYSTNLLLDMFHEDYYEEPAEEIKDVDLESALSELLDEAVKRGIIENSIGCRDLFDTKLMNCLVPRPSEVQRTFREKYKESPQAATDWFYKFSQDTDYIRRYRAKKDLRWKTASDYGDIDITINLAKPEKDPKAIAAAGKAKSSSYPKCLLCMENEGYAGTLTHPARENHRIIPITINHSPWGLQYSPYGYYNEHCIAFNFQHVPMKIDHAAFAKLFDFVGQFPHYFLGSNADLPIVGGSILSHDHFQGGHYTFAMAKAGIEIPYTVPGFEDVESGIVKWPLSVFRIRSESPDRLIALADLVLKAWRGYTDEKAFIFAETDGTPHNTITPIARIADGKYELDLTLRNNITTKERPLGVYHPRPEYFHIKKENIGLIEVMGLAVLPSRLKTEMNRLGSLIADGRAAGDTDEMTAARVREDETIEKHADWVAKFLPKYPEISKNNIEDILREEIGRVFTGVLEDAGVYKWTDEGHEAFLKFLKEAVK